MSIPVSVDTTLPSSSQLHLGKVDHGPTRLEHLAIHRAANYRVAIQHSKAIMWIHLLESALVQGIAD